MSKKKRRTRKGKKRIQPRDGNIILAIKRELNLTTRKVESKRKYSRKKKHKNYKKDIE